MLVVPGGVQVVQVVQVMQVVQVQAVPPRWHPPLLGSLYPFV